MVGDGIEHDAEGQNMAGHYKDQEEELSAAKNFTAPTPKNDFASVCHVMDVGVTHLELSNYVAGICSNEAKPEDENYAS